MRMWESFPLLAEEMAAFERYLAQRHGGKGRFERRAADRLFRSGGKRLRPALAILCAMLGQYSREAAFPAAAAVELIHTASLVHDDIVDHADTRRGAPTLSGQHGAAVAVYMGDYLLAQALIELAEAPLGQAASRKLALGVKAMCAGEIEQFFARQAIPTVAEYLKRIMRKTALLFSAACHVGARCAGQEGRLLRALSLFGFHMGVAFQIRDDLLDLRPEAADGKPFYQDVAEGIITLPMILAAQRDAAFNDRIRADGLSAIPGGEVGRIVRQSGGMRSAEEYLERYRSKAMKSLEPLPHGEAKQALCALAEWL